MWAVARQDWAANSGRRRIQIMLVIFRLAQYWRKKSGASRILGVALGRIYKFYSEVGCAIEFPIQTVVGPNLAIHHGYGLVVNGNAKIGADVTLRHGVTIGSVRNGEDAPVIEDGVDVGAGAIIIGSINLGQSCRIGAGAVVVADVPARRVAVGNPARLVGGTSP